jgi:hypothetical protein
MPVNFYPRLSLTGGVAGSLDNLDGATLADLDIAMVGQMGVDAKFYILDADSGVAESSPDIISPDLNPGTKRWILLGVYADTVDVSTDFTVGDTVITNGAISDTGVFTLAPAGGLVIGGAGLVYVGQNDVLRGQITLYGNTTGQPQGGKQIQHTAADYDTTINYYAVDVYEDDLRIGPDTDPDALKYDGGTGQWVFSSTTAGIKMGGTVITDATITDDGVLYIVPTTSMQVRGGGVLGVGQNNIQRGQIALYGNATGSPQGGNLFQYLAVDYDTTINYYGIDV